MAANVSSRANSLAEVPIKYLIAVVIGLAIVVAIAFPFKAYSEPPKVEQKRDLRYYTDLHNADYDLTYSIATCESELKPFAKNPNSTAKGVFQFLNGTWKYYGLMKWGTLEGKDVYDFEDNVELATWVIGKYGTKDWNPSKHCWEPMNQMLSKKSQPQEQSLLVSGYLPSSLVLKYAVSH